MVSTIVWYVQVDTLDVEQVVNLDKGASLFELFVRKSCIINFAIHLKRFNQIQSVSSIAYQENLSSTRIAQIIYT